MLWKLRWWSYDSWVFSFFSRLLLFTLWNVLLNVTHSVMEKAVKTRAHYERQCFTSHIFATDQFSLVSFIGTENCMSFRCFFDVVVVKGAAATSNVIDSAIAECTKRERRKQHRNRKTTCVVTFFFFFRQWKLYDILFCLCFHIPEIVLIKKKFIHEMVGMKKEAKKSFSFFLSHSPVLNENRTQNQVKARPQSELIKCNKSFNER